MKTIYQGNMPPNLMVKNGEVVDNPEFYNLSLAQRDYLLGSGSKVYIPEGWSVFKPTIALKDVRDIYGDKLGIIGKIWWIIKEFIKKLITIIGI